MTSNLAIFMKGVMVKYRIPLRLNIINSVGASRVSVYDSYIQHLKFCCEQELFTQKHQGGVLRRHFSLSNCWDKDYIETGTLELVLDQCRTILPNRFSAAEDIRSYILELENLIMENCDSLNDVHEAYKSVNNGCFIRAIIYVFHFLCCCTKTAQVKEDINGKIQHPQVSKENTEYDMSMIFKKCSPQNNNSEKPHGTLAVLKLPLLEEEEFGQI